MGLREVNLREDLVLGDSMMGGSPLPPPPPPWMPVVGAFEASSAAESKVKSSRVKVAKDIDRPPFFVARVAKGEGLSAKVLSCFPASSPASLLVLKCALKWGILA